MNHFKLLHFLKSKDINLLFFINLKFASVVTGKSIKIINQLVKIQK